MCKCRRGFHSEQTHVRCKWIGRLFTLTNAESVKLVMERTRHTWKVLHGLGCVPDEADVACSLLQDVKKHSEYCVTKPVIHVGHSVWHSIHMDVVCGPDEDIQKRERSALSPNASALLSWVDAIRDPLTVFGKANMPYQPFQNLMVMDFLFYLIQRECPTEMDEIIHRCKRELSLHGVTTEEIRAMKERVSIKHSVYIIPRRHGKTAMSTALMATTVLFVEDIVIGYGCHRKRALKEAFKTTLNVVLNIRKRNKLDGTRIETLAGELIRVRNKETQRSSSILFIPLQNDKVTYMIIGVQNSLIICGSSPSLCTDHLCLSGYQTRMITGKVFPFCVCNVVTL